MNIKHWRRGKSPWKCGVSGASGGTASIGQATPEAGYTHLSAPEGGTWIPSTLAGPVPPHCFSFISPSRSLLCRFSS